MGLRVYGFGLKTVLQGFTGFYRVQRLVLGINRVLMGLSVKGLGFTGFSMVYRQKLATDNKLFYAAASWSMQ